MRVDVVDTRKQAVGKIDLEDSVFAAPVKSWLFYEVVKQQLASRRAGTHSTKTVSMVQGTRKKPYRQKGTGQARHGTLRAVGMRGGGTVHKPHPRDYSYDLPKKMVKGALRSALSLRLSEQKLHVVSGWAPAKPKTKGALEVLGAFKADKALIIGEKSNEGLAKSLRNIPHVKFLPVEAINVYDLLKHEHVFISDKVIAELNERLKTAPSRKDKELAAAKA